MSELLHSKLLADIPIEVQGLGKIYSPKLKDIANIGEDIYNQYLSILLFDIKHLKNDIDSKDFEELEKLHPLETISLKAYYDENFRDLFLEALSFFFYEKANYYNGVFYFDGDRVLNYENFEQVIYLIKYINLITTDKPSEVKYANDKAKEIAEKIKIAQEKVNKVKAKQGVALSLFDLISAFSANSYSINLMTVWDMTIYQFNDQFKRMQLIEEYDINIRSLLAGADPKRVEINHWVSKI